MVTGEELAVAVGEARSKGLKVVFTNGCFDIIHRGHTEYLAGAKGLGDMLVVGVNTDRSVRELKGEARPVVPEDDRAHVLAALASVDLVCLFDEDTPLKLIESIVPDVLVKGAGYDRDTIVGADFVERHGGSVAVMEEVPGRATRDIIARILGTGRE